MASGLSPAGFWLQASKSCGDNEGGFSEEGVDRVECDSVSPTAALEFVRRLVLTVITGNGDMHLKNWSLIYPGNGDKPVLAPIYDVLSTVP